LKQIVFLEVAKVVVKICFYLKPNHHNQVKLGPIPKTHSISLPEGEMIRYNTPHRNQTNYFVGGAN